MAKRKKKYPFWFESPFEAMRRIEESFHRTMAEMWREPFEFKFRVPEMKFPLARTIPVDIAETDSELIIRADLPGFEKDEIRLKVTPTTVDISAEKKKETIERGKTFFKQERAYGAARRMMTLPVEIKPEDAKAKFEAGVLTIEMPKMEIKKKAKKEVKIE